MSEQQYVENQVYQINIDNLTPNPDQPRQYFNEEALQDLAKSITRDGLIQPIVAKMPADGEQIQIIAGERRLKAARIAEMTEVPVIFKNGDPAELALIENLLRENLNPIEEAEALAKLKEAKGCTQDDLAEIIGKAKSTVSEILKLNDLKSNIKTKVRESNQYSRSMLLDIARKDKNEQTAAFRKLEAHQSQLDRVAALANTRQGSAHRKSFKIAADLCPTLINRLDAVNISELDASEQETLAEALRQLTVKISEVLGQFGAPNRDEERSV